MELAVLTKLAMRLFYEHFCDISQKDNDVRENEFDCTFTDFNFESLDDACENSSDCTFQKKRW